MKTSVLIVSTVCSLLTFAGQNFAADPPSTDNTANASDDAILPPAMSVKPEAAPASAPGETLFIDDGEKQFTLFLPKAFDPVLSAEIPLTIHFAGDASLAITEHARRGLSGPLIVAAWGAGVETYRVPFTDRTRISRWFKLAEDALKAKGAPDKLRFTAIDISAYGGGYGAIRELLKSEENVKLIRRLVLCDSLYGSYDKSGGTVTRKLSAEHLEPWLPIARAAVKGEKTFAFTYSQTPTTGYASCSECAAAIAEAVGATIDPVELDSSPAANEEKYPLLYRADMGHLHLWGYEGSSDEGRLVHLKHLGDTWKVLDEAGSP